MTKVKLRAEELERIAKLTGTKKDSKYNFLGYTFDLRDADLSDPWNLGGVPNEIDIRVLTVILFHYALANASTKTGKLIKFKDIPGGPAYELAFLQRAVQPIAKAFGSKPETLYEAAKLIGGKKLTHGDASVEVPALADIPLSYILWAADEFSAEASILFDCSASCYLPTEDLAVLGELTSNRLKMAQQLL